MAVNTKHVTGRRKLRFSSYREMLDEVHCLAGQPTRQLGNWTLGQICEHLAVAIDASIDGAPFRAQWYVRLAGPFLKKRMLTRGLPPGFQLPKNAAALIPTQTDASAGIAALEKSVERVLRTVERKPNAVFGPMTRDEWDQLQFRHAEMHLSFIVPESTAS